MGLGKKNKYHNNIRPHITEEQSKTCQICDRTFKSKAALAGHLGAKHKVKVSDYIVEHYLGGERPSCPLCGEETLYVRGDSSFKKYCPQHASEGRKAWSKENGYGSVGGPDSAWRRGLTKDTHPGIRAQSEAVRGAGNPWFGKRHTPDVIARITALRSEKMRVSIEQFQEKKEALAARFKILTPHEEYQNNKQLLDVECSCCGAKEKRSLWALQLYATCKTCSPASVQEMAVREMIKSMGVKVENNNRSVIGPQELDIYLPDQAFAVEYNGLYWHSEERKGRKYHSEKTKACREKEVQLFHIFEDEWNEKQEIIESMISQRIGCADERIFARKCEVRVVPRKDSKEFFNDTHISGNTRSKITFGLYHQDELVMAFSCRVPFHRVHRQRQAVEIARLSSKRGTVVVGGFSKLLKKVKAWSAEEGYKEILTYADLRFGTGGVYEKAGFTKDKDTPLDYWYTDGKVRYNRFKYRAQPGKTEKQVAKEAGVWKIYGCGSATYTLSL